MQSHLLAPEELEEIIARAFKIFYEARRERERAAPRPWRLLAPGKGRERECWKSSGSSKTSAPA
ncbi:hypothetical protein Adeg_0872 [Ammonifex degensii KC4]|uniref:Uncharacterized protein n=1 Tax=Ammonifex degensii (strain DSM 10501 / KC4) TaxID=429009 RepID=C9RCN4_AMMDK|nr:hypothetical protein Adeg_0872 [Ammonifex degensii KC4]